MDMMLEGFPWRLKACRGPTSEPERLFKVARTVLKRCKGSMGGRNGANEEAEFKKMKDGAIGNIVFEVDLV